MEGVSLTSVNVPSNPLPSSLIISPLHWTSVLYTAALIRTL